MRSALSLSGEPRTRRFINVVCSFIFYVTNAHARDDDFVSDRAVLGLLDRRANHDCGSLGSLDHHVRTKDGVMAACASKPNVDGCDLAPPLSLSSASEIAFEHACVAVRR